MSRFKLFYTIVILLSFSVSAYADGAKTGSSRLNSKEYRDILRLSESGMYSRSLLELERLYKKVGNSDPEARALLSEISMNLPGYQGHFDAFVERYPHSTLIPQMRYRHALNLFDRKSYPEAYEQFSLLNEKRIYRGQIDEFLFKRAYCHLDAGRAKEAMTDFQAVAGRKYSDFTYPSTYAVAYLYYESADFNNAYDWFLKSCKDSRFKEMSQYYMLECRFMLKDYVYVINNGPEVYATAQKERKRNLARMISEAYLVEGDAVNARKYYDDQETSETAKTRTDWFYSGSVMYAVRDYAGAVKAFSNMSDRTDSLGQIANYQMAYSYIKLKNKVAAMAAFKGASEVKYDASIAEDALFNYAKLAFDLNSDSSVFLDYLKVYQEKKKGDKIYGYIAVAALLNRDYEGAVEAFDCIDELDDDMVSNYMKANYLRAKQLFDAGSYRSAIPCLKASSYYSEKTGKFHQLSQFYLAESYFRNEDYVQSRQIYTNLYNNSALYGLKESSLITYGIAHCSFAQGEYQDARKWFAKYLEEPVVTYRKDAMQRLADCYFVEKSYKESSVAYERAFNEYFDVNDIYPYYQAAISYGLTNNRTRKAELLSNVLKADPSSPFYADALFELGRTYAVAKKNTDAMMCFKKVTDVVRDSTFVAKAYIEMGSIARNQGKYEEALSYYKTVVETMSLSGYASDALLSIESIYQSKNEPQKYLAYIDSIGKGAMKTDAEKEDMIFNAAEQIYISNNYQKAISAFKAFQKEYPDSKNMTRSYYYIAESYKAMSQYEQACDNYKLVVDGGDAAFVELALLHLADLSFKLEKWDESYGSYSSLAKSTSNEKRLFTASLGMVRSAFRAHKWIDAISAVEKLQGNENLTDALKSELKYVKAKSYLATSRRDEAYVIFEELSGSVKDSYGAESAYLIAQDHYDKGEFSAVKDCVFAFSEKGTSHMYWLAKSFLVLGDAYAEEGNLVQAKATFESILAGYKPENKEEDDVVSAIELRLKKLNEMEKN